MLEKCEMRGERTVCPYCSRPAAASCTRLSCSSWLPLIDEENGMDIGFAVGCKVV